MQVTLTLIVLAAAVAYVAYTAFRVLSGRSTGCGCHRECPRKAKKNAP